MTVRDSTEQTAAPGPSGAVPRHSFKKERRRTPPRPLRRRGAPLDPARRALCAGVKRLWPRPAQRGPPGSVPLSARRFAQAQWGSVAAPFRVVTPGRAPGVVVGWLASWRLEGKTVGPGCSGRSLGLRTERPRSTIPEFERSFERVMKCPPRLSGPSDA